MIGAPSNVPDVRRIARHGGDAHPLDELVDEALSLGIDEGDHAVHEARVYHLARRARASRSSDSNAPGSFARCPSDAMARSASAGRNPMPVKVTRNRSSSPEA